jgi:hypothetical protein
MPKKKVKKASSKKKKKTVKTVHKEAGKKPKTDISRQIKENLVSLQKVELNMADKFNSLSKQLSSLLNMFEKAAKSFAEHPSIADKEMADKLDHLIKQNEDIIKKLGGKAPPAPPSAPPAPPSAPTPPSPPPAERPAPPREEFRPSAPGRPLPRF